MAQPIFDIEILIKPEAAPRPRCRKAFPAPYNPTAYNKWLKELRAKLAEHAPEPGSHAGGYYAVVIVRRKRPKTTKLPFPKPDVDNFAKGVLDAASKALYDDDWRIADLFVAKRWGKVDSVQITLYELNEDNFEEWV